VSRQRDPFDAATTSAPDPLDELRDEVAFAEYQAAKAAEEADLRDRRAALTGKAAETPATAASTRKRGRPKGTHTHSDVTIVAAWRNYIKQAGKKPTMDELAASLQPTVTRTTLAKHLKTYKMPWPIE
jgi:hypothetical protein